MKSIRRILVPVDYSTTSRIALEAAFSLGRSFGADLEVLHTWAEPGYIDPTLSVDVNAVMARRAKEEMEVFLAEIEPPSNVRLSYRVQNGIAWQVITELSESYDLIVMGTHGRTGIQRLVLGSVAARVVQHAKCPVLTVREPGSERARARKKEEQILHAMFEDTKDIEKAFDELRAIGVPMEKISLVMTEDTHDRDFKALDRTKALKGVTAGSVMGGAIGGILGGLTSLGMVVTGGIGLVIMGPALAFAAAGGLFGGLLGRTVPDDRALVLKAELTEGKTLMAVHLDDPTMLPKVSAIVEAAGGELIAL
jgi:nucleotide-binding universal stress UspA family protein